MKDELKHIYNSQFVCIVYQSGIHCKAPCQLNWPFFGFSNESLLLSFHYNDYTQNASPFTF